MTKDAAEIIEQELKELRKWKGEAEDILHDSLDALSYTSETTLIEKIRQLLEISHDA